jgi:uncharacterized membrane protein YqjE
MAAVKLLKFLPALALMALILGVIRSVSTYFAHGLCVALATTWGLQCIGPSFSGWRTSSSVRSSCPRPFSFPNYR